MTRTTRPVQVLIVGSVLFTFIGYWQTAAIVLCDLASTIYYIGGIVEQAIGPAAPWFIALVMAFSFFVRMVYLESCSLFVRGGVYRVVRAAMGAPMGKLAVSALLFDYLLTGPISSVSAGQYLSGLVLEVLQRSGLATFTAGQMVTIRSWAAVAFALTVTAYFWRLNVRGVQESSRRALQIMLVTTSMVVLMFGWCGVTLLVDGPRNPWPTWEPNFDAKMNYDAHDVIDPLGFVGRTSLADHLRPAKTVAEHGQTYTQRGSPSFTEVDWWSLVGVFGLLVAFGHSILAMSGEETLAQVYREVEAPKMQNFKKAAWIVFLFSFCVTPTICFLAVLLIPDDVRMPQYSSNLIGGLAMHVTGPLWARLLLNAFVTLVGALILSGAVNTAMIGANGVLNRVAEDKVLPAFMQKPHPRFGTTYRLLSLIAALQALIIVFSQGDVIFLGEAYAFGVVWSFTLKTAAMLMLRFKDPSPREFRVPGNIPLGNGREFPLGLALILALLLSTAVTNLLTKEVATIGGLLFTGLFMAVFTVTEYWHRRVTAQRERAEPHSHLEQFNHEIAETLSRPALGLEKPYLKLVAIRSPHNLHMLTTALAEVDPESTDLVVMTAKVTPGAAGMVRAEMDRYDRELMTAVVAQAEKAGKEVVPVIVATNNPLFAILSAARELGAQEVILGASNKFTAEEQLDQVALYWLSLTAGQQRPLTIRILGRNWDTHLDLAGGKRIPTIRERRARSVADLRAAGIGIRRVLLLLPASVRGQEQEWFETLLTLLDDSVALGVATTAETRTAAPALVGFAAEQLQRPVQHHPLETATVAAIVHLVRAEHYDLLILPRPAAGSIDPTESTADQLGADLLREAPCRVAWLSPPAIPREVESDEDPGQA